MEVNDLIRHKSGRLFIIKGFFECLFGNKYVVLENQKTGNDETYLKTGLQYFTKEN